MTSAPTGGVLAPDDGHRPPRPPPSSAGPASPA